MKSTYTQKISRKILLAFLAFVIILAIAALFVRDSISHKLQDISNLAHNVEYGQAKPQQILLLLNEAEDDFQESLLSSDDKKSTAYKAKLSEAFVEMDTLLKEHTDTLDLTTEQHKKVRYWQIKKIQLSARLYSLKHNFDSLLTVYAGFNTEATKGVTTISLDKSPRKKVVENKTDTIKKTSLVKKKGFFGRIKDAISNKNTNGGGTNIIEVNHTHTSHIVDSATRRLEYQDKKVYNQKLKQLQERNVKLLTTQKQLISLNIHIRNELEGIINEVKEINYNITNEFKGMTFKNYQETTALLNKFYLAALFLVLVFATLLIVFVIRLGVSETLLLQENERSITIAKQKMDLLQHMSHEIRNPLTAIKGFLYIFSQTNLSPRQADMLGSIRLSSDMLLRTLNDTLDAAKMENSEFKINKDPFNADFVLKEVIESMEFSATKKALSLNYNFVGDKEALVLGDSFRLKQVMVNLLSNAIKYTNNGGITVNANLTSINGGPQLQVDIVDTGAGISLEQQANLFSKYYQTNSAKGQTGTGLGLYICKQLVELQDGQISVKSIASKGSTFSFFIPYQEAKNINDVLDKQKIEDPLSLLNGISILAVDDNELSLMFLKMMTSKWNIKFYQASDGKQALGILARETITIVLTDIQMPTMDGNELIAAIRQLQAPLNKVPVIVISGSSKPSDGERFSKKGFSGFVTKPFVEVELIKQIIKALKSQ
ncbi:hybrid sensor histidine kinase/response regulator [Mucilaginibacter sp. SP1R1]|uniref:hybrid sensor histidine kinase/response regulator n=1 Tax=Mucilaginibacter sp. SP1R1 TaxID=2723091 RepID=UPI00161090FC|nr:hybrid sensor histidine kinase/response regulator [Mucilaginibacter sp. SP1R1]MBB6148978.1 signal transduction histidine kinase [Mucilaginibacter sp. SP1R1]